MKKLLLTATLIFSLFQANAQTPEFEWMQAIGEGLNFIRITEIAVDADSNYLLAGSYIGTGDMDPGAGTSNISSPNKDIFVAKYSPSGAFLWVKTINPSGSYDEPKGLKLDRSGNVHMVMIVSGTADINPDAGVLSVDGGNVGGSAIVKLSPSGSFIWGYMAENVQSTSFSNPESFDLDQYGNIYFTGNIYGDVDFDFSGSSSVLTGASMNYFAKLNASGQFVWVHPYDLYYLNSMIYDTSNHTLFLAGNVMRNNVDLAPNSTVSAFSFPGASNVVIVRVDSAGNYISHVYIESDNSVEINHIRKNKDHFFVYGEFTGTADFDPSSGTTSYTSTRGNGTNPDLFVAKYDMGNNHLWTRTLSGENSIIDGGITIDNYDNVYFTGYGYGNTDTDPGPADDIKSAGLYILKLNSSGERQWVYHDPGQIMAAHDLFLNTFDHSLMASGYFAQTVDFDPQSTQVLRYAPSGSGFLFKWNNCNSIVVDTIITENAGVLSVTDTIAGASFQWFDCDSRTAINGENSSDFTPSKSGNYQVLITNGVCSVFSSCYSFSNPTGVKTAPENQFSIYPNPANHTLMISGLETASDIRVINTLGQNILCIPVTGESQAVDITGLAVGIYYIQVQSNGILNSKVFIKN